MVFARVPRFFGFGNRSEVYGTDVYVKYRPLSGGRFTTIALHAEWLYRRRQIPHDVLQDLTGFASLAIRFAQRWWAAGR